jgi:ABC-type tungstate transport system substrate-binding protein
VFGVDGNPSSTNLFAYTNGNPINYTDAAGYFRMKVTTAGLIIDVLLIMIPYIVSLFGSVKAFSKAARFSIWARQVVAKLTKKISKAILSVIDEITYAVVGHIAHASARAFTLAGIQSIVVGC